MKGALLAPETRFWCSERGAKKRQKQKRKKSSGGRQNRWAEAGGAGSGKGGKRKRQRGSKLSNKQEKAKGKAQESRHQNRFPPLFYRAPPFTLEHKRSRGLFRKSKFVALICNFSREGFWLRCGMGGGAGWGVREYIYIYIYIYGLVQKNNSK